MDYNNNENIYEEGISISELWDIFKSRFTWFISTLIVVVVVAIVYLQYVIPQYSSTVTVLVEPITASSSLDDLMLSNLSSSSSKISTEVELIKSRSNINSAIALLDLSHYKDSVGVPYSEFFSIGPNSDAISVSFVKDTKLVSISVTNENPKFAADFANALSVSYDQLLTSIAKNSKTTQIDFLKEQIPINEEELQVASNKLSDYKEESGVLQLTEKSSALVNQITYYELRRDPLQIQIIEADSKIENIQKSMMEKNIVLPTYSELTLSEEFISLSNQYKVSNSELIMHEAINYAANSASVTGATLTSSRTVELTNTISQFSKQMLDYINLEIGSYHSEDIYANALLNEYSKSILSKATCNIGLEVLEERSKQFTEELDQLPIIERRVLELQRDVTVLQQIGIQLRTMLEEVKLLEAAVSGNVTIVDKAIVPNKPVSPNKLLIMAVAILLGAALGFLLALVVNMADNTIKRTEQLRKLLKPTNIPLLGWIPLVKDKTINPTSKKNTGYLNLSVYEDPLAFESEKYMTIVSNIIYSSGIKKNRSIAITSCDVSEGKSSLIANMALCLANMGNKVLLVDGDFRMPSIEAKFGYSRSKLGLVNYIQEDNIDINDIVLQPIEEMPLLHILPPGRLPLVPIAVLTSPKMEILNELAGEYYDYILIDAPPLEYASEVLTFGERFDSLVVNIRANITTKTALNTLLQSLNRIHDKIAGVVLNACLPNDAETTANVSSKYGYGYGSKYGSKYFYGSDKAKNNRAVTSRHRAIRVYKQSLKYRKIRDTDFQRKKPVSPKAYILKDKKTNDNSDMTRNDKEEIKVSTVIPKQESISKTEVIVKESKVENKVPIEKKQNKNKIEPNKEIVKKQDEKKLESDKKIVEKPKKAEVTKKSEDNNVSKKESNYDEIFSYLENDPAAKGKAIKEEGKEEK